MSAVSGRACSRCKCLLAVLLLPSVACTEIGAYGNAVMGSSGGAVSATGGTGAPFGRMVAPRTGAGGAAGAAAGIGSAPTAGGAAGAAAGTGSVSTAPAAAGQSAMPPVLPPGPGPMLPALLGECPVFVNGTSLMVAGHGGVTILAGAPGKGGHLLFYWHGAGGTPQEAMTGLPESTRREIIESGGIIAAFDGSRSSRRAADCSGTDAHNIADFDAVDQIAACAVKDHGIDPRRIYTTGCGAGGLQAGCLAMLRSSYLAVSAPSSGGVLDTITTWQNEHSPAIFTMHGGPSDLAASQTSAQLDRIAKAHGSFVVNCNYLGDSCQAPAVVQGSAWKFMKDHPWGVQRSAWAAGIPFGIPSYCTLF